jgi:hypothetical protein
MQFPRAGPPVYLPLDSLYPNIAVNGGPVNGIKWRFMTQTGKNKKAPAQAAQRPNSERNLYGPPNFSSVHPAPEAVRGGFIPVPECVYHYDSPTEGQSAERNFSYWTAWHPVRQAKPISRSRLNPLYSPAIKIIKTKPLNSKPENQHPLFVIYALLRFLNFEFTF